VFVGHEIADHTLSHKINFTYWGNGTYETYRHEIIGLRDQFEAHGMNDVIGYRQPFLQSAGDPTYSVLQDYGFKYDSTLVTELNDFFWPYTLNHKVPYCGTPPCPTCK